MTTTLPQITRQIDDEFTETWYEIRAEAVDNILDAYVVSAALRDAGSFKTQVGSNLITRTVKYGKKSASGFGKGSVLPADEADLETMAIWEWKYFTTPITRSLIDDQQNSGPTKIKDYITKRITAAREAMIEGIEDFLMRDAMHLDNDSSSTMEDAKEPFGIFDFVPDLAATNYRTSSYEYGGIQRDNPWWQHRDFSDDVTINLVTQPNSFDVFAGPAALTVYDDMKKAYRRISNNQKAPNLVIMQGDLYELYENFVDSKDQLIKDATTHLADLGYEVLRFKGKPVIWTDALDTVAGASITTYQALMLDMDAIEVIYDPNLWFDMSEWRVPERQHERVSYISSSMQVISAELRRHGRLKWTA